MRYFYGRRSPVQDVSVERHVPSRFDWEPADSDFRRTIRSGELRNGESEVVEIRDTGVVLTRFDGRVLGFLDVCPHWGGSFLENPVHGDQIRCPWHGWCWSLETGELEAPIRSDKFPLRWIPARECDGWIEVALPPSAPATDRAARQTVGS